MRAQRLDLHLHTDRSDGRHSPTEVLRLCALGRLDVVALTDHDRPPEIAAGGHTVGGRAVHVVHGVELSTMHAGEELHLLVYFPGTMPDAFAEFCAERARWRADWYDEAVRCIDLPGIPPADDDARSGRRTLTRWHLARALVDAGHARRMSQAFDRWVGVRAGVIPDLDLSFRTALNRAVAAGGLTSWAHPSPRQARAWTKRFAGWGLHALEAWRPRVGRHHRAVLSRLANRSDLAITGGSDWHGWHPGDVGTFSFPRQLAGPIADRLGLAQHCS